MSRRVSQYIRYINGSDLLSHFFVFELLYIFISLPNCCLSIYSPWARWFWLFLNALPFIIITFSKFINKRCLRRAGVCYRCYYCYHSHIFMQRSALWSPSISISSKPCIYGIFSIIYHIFLSSKFLFQGTLESRMTAKYFSCSERSSDSPFTEAIVTSLHYL